MDGASNGPINLEIPMSSPFASWPSARPHQSELPLIESPCLLMTANVSPILLAQRELGWQPQVSLEQGLEPTIAWFQELLGRGCPEPADWSHRRKA